MRCYRCGALMEAHATVCPECGFDLNSPVEIETTRRMHDLQVLDAEGVLLGECAGGGETVYVNAPALRTVRIRWGGMEEVRNVINGEAYRFEQTKLALGFVRLIKTRSVPKRKRNASPDTLGPSQ